MRAIRQHSGHAALTRLISLTSDRSHEAKVRCEGKSRKFVTPGEPLDYTTSSERPLDWVGSAPTFQKEMMRKYRAKYHLGFVYSGAGESPPDLDDGRSYSKMLKVVDEMKAGHAWSAGPGDQPFAQIPVELPDTTRCFVPIPPGAYHFLHSDDHTCSGCSIPARYCGCEITSVEACRRDLDVLLCYE